MKSSPSKLKLPLGESKDFSVNIEAVKLETSNKKVSEKKPRLKEGVENCENAGPQY